MKGKNVLVTGGLGFIGSNIAESLSSVNEVRIIDNFSSGELKNIEGFQKRVELIKGDIRDRKVIESALDGIDVVFHEAANVFIEDSLKDPAYDSSVNVIGTINLLEGCRKRDVEKVVFASSSAVYGNVEQLPVNEDCPPTPDSPYGISKLCGEYFFRLYHELYEIDTVILRYFNVYGRRQSAASPYSGVIAIFMKNIRGKEPLTIYGDGEQTRDFVSVDDVVRANVLAAESKGLGGRIFNIGTGRAVSINALAQILMDLGGKTEIEYALPRLGDVRESVADVNRAAEELGFEAAIDIKAGLKDLLKQSN